MNPQHRMLIEMEPTGFGVKYEDNLSAYTPPHWHKAVELLLFVKGRVTCNFENAKRQFKAGDIYILNSHEVHETKCTRGARYLVVHIEPTLMLRYVPTFDQLRFSLTFDPEDQARAMAYEQLRSHMREILRLTEETEPVLKLDRQARLFAVTALLVKYFSQPLAMADSFCRRTCRRKLRCCCHSERTKPIICKECSHSGTAKAGSKTGSGCSLLPHARHCSFRRYRRNPDTNVSGTFPLLCAGETFCCRIHQICV